MVWNKPRAGLKIKLRIISLWTLAFASALLTLLAIHQLLLPVIAWCLPQLDQRIYDIGSYGAYPTQEYVSFNLSSPRSSHVRWDEQCERGFVLISPNGDAVSRPGPMILDSTGDLVWMSDAFGTTMNLNVHRYQGQDYLTFWAGNKAGSTGKGAYYLLDAAYNVVRTVSPVGQNLQGDIHEFKITRNDTALMTVYNVTNMDLSAMGRPVDGWITDSIFQEIDIATGALIFQWRASDHFRGNDSYMTNPFAGYTESIPFDFYHINSVDKDSQGNYIISSRHFHTVTCISPTGETLWVFGGRSSSFADLSDGKASEFRWQHDARWVSEEDGILSLFDNEDAGVLHVDAAYSKGMTIQLDVANRTATLQNTYTSLQLTRAASQGSLQVLPESGNVFIGWGSSAAYGEFSRDGTLLCESHFGASWLYWWSRIKSYRAYKTADWIGTPEYPPTVMIQSDKLYVSWNGATEVKFWELQRTLTDEAEEEDFEPVDIIEKEGFEGSFTLPSAGLWACYRVAALDQDKQVLGYSNEVEEEPSQIGLGFWVPAFVVLAIVWWLVGPLPAVKRALSRQRSHCMNWTRYKYAK